MSATPGNRNSRPFTSDVLNKKIPENPKYKYMKSTLDTGASMTKYMSKIEEIRKNYRYRKDEIFKRMKITTFVQLILQVEAYNTHQQEEDYRSLESQATNRELQNLKNGQGDGPASPVPSLALTQGDFGEVEEVDTARSRSTLQSVIKGIGEFDVDDNSVPLTPTLAKPESSSSPYLLLDLREQESYEQCHIITAKNYPTAMLSRSTNNFTNDILSYKNKAGKIIVMYDEDERMGPMAAATFVERDFNNTFLLSGGLKLAVQKFPSGLVTGTVPVSCRPQPPAQVGRKKPREPRHEPIRPADQTWFTDSDVDKLLVYLETCFTPSDSATLLSRQTPRTKSTVSSGKPAETGRASSSVSHSSHWK